MKHDHVGHEHKVKYCKKCDTVFCEVDTCNTEWSTNTTWNIDNWTGTITTDTFTGDVSHLH